MFHWLLQCDRACEGAEMLMSAIVAFGGLMCFNVTAPVKARKCCWCACLPWRVERFNVTAPVKARKSFRASAGDAALVALQCDRACEGAEMGRL